MTGEQWLACKDTRAMLTFLEGRVSDRDPQLAAAVCCRVVWGFVSDRRLRKLVRTFERFIDGDVPDHSLDQARRDITRERGRNNEPLPSGNSANYIVLSGCLRRPNLSEVLAGVNSFMECPKGPSLLRCLLNPFPCVRDPRWRTSDAIGLAQAIYDEGAFDRLPILADALMDAGCADELVIGHCRCISPHVHGCWVVDLILGKQ